MRGEGEGTEVTSRFDTARLRAGALAAAATVALLLAPAAAGAQIVEARRGMVSAQEPHAARAGLEVLEAGGSAVDAAVATAFALAVTHPQAGNIGGGGFMIVRPPAGPPAAYDFREAAPAAADAEMFVVDGEYDAARHHDSHVAVGVPGTVAGLHMAWSERGRLPWRRLLEPAIALARDGFAVPAHLARSLAGVLPAMRRYPASVAQFSRDGRPYAAGETLRQPDLARTLERIAAAGPDGFYRGPTAELVAREMQANGGLITTDDLAAYRAVRRTPVRGTYRGHDIISMPPPSSGGTVLVEMLNVLEGFDLAAAGHNAPRTVHLMAETMRRAYADRARHLGDPDFNPALPLPRLLSKDYAARLRRSIDPQRASRSSPASFTWPAAGGETTHLSVVDAERLAVALTYTLEQRYGSKIVVPGAGFLLNNEMGDFNPAPGLTTAEGLIGTPPNLAAPGKRMLSSMTPTIVARDGRLRLVTGSPGGRTIINTVLHTIVNVVDFEMDADAAVNAPRFHHQWLPDRIVHERNGLEPGTRARLAAQGHALTERASQGVVQAIAYDAAGDRLAGAPDRRAPGSTVLGY